MARRTHTQNTKKPRKRPYNGISEAFRWYEPLGPVPEVTAADQEDQRFAAHAAFVADAAADCKRGKRANGALERASFGENGAFRCGSAGIRACAGRARRARRAAKRGKTGGEQWDKSAKPMGLCPIALFSRVFGLSTLGFRRFINGTENRFTTKSKQRKKSSGSALGFSVLGGAAFCVAALVEICPEYRLFFPGADAAVLVVNQVKNFLLSIHRQ